MEDMIELFKDESIVHSPVKVVMVNTFGKEEWGLIMALSYEMLCLHFGVRSMIHVP